MSRTSPVHYIAPSAISIIPNANGSANDIAVHIASGTKIKVYCRTLGIDMVNATFQEWAIAGKNRRLANENVPYTIYARLPKTDKGKGYLIFAPKLQVDDKWTDKYCYITPNGMSSEGTADDSNWYVKIGDVSEVDNAQRILDLDTGILGTDQYNSEWNLNPDDFPLRVEIDCTINDEPAGSYPYVRWSEQVRLSARLLQGFAAATDLSQVDHWGIYKNLGEQAPELAPTPDWPDAQRKELFQTTGDITLYHSRDGVDDFDGAEACIFTVVAWGAPADATELDGGNPSYVQKAIATVTLHAETYEVLSSEDIPDDPEDFVPSDTTLFTGAAMDAYLKRYPHYFRKDQPDTDPHLATFGNLHIASGLDKGGGTTSAGNLEVDGDAELKGDVKIGASASNKAIVNAVMQVLTQMKSKNYVDDNPLGKGGWNLLSADDNGNSYLVIDKLFVRLKAIFNELEIRKISYAGGNIILSHAGSEIVGVKPLYRNGSIYAYRCYCKKDDGTTATKNWWKEDDQAKCQTFNIEEGVHQNVKNTYYWRMVVAVGSEIASLDGTTSEELYNYVDLSLGDCDANSDIPKAGDSIIQMGNRTDTGRQGFISLEVFGSDAPALKIYEGVNGYTLEDKRPIILSPKNRSMRVQHHEIETDYGVFPAVKERGEWDLIDEHKCYYFDRVQHNGSSWLCTYPQGSTPKYTTEEPSVNATYWKVDAQAGESAPSYTEEWYAWSNVQSVVNATTEPTPNGGWNQVIGGQGAYAYLWKKLIRYTWNSATRVYVAGTAQYFRMSGTNGTSISVKGSVATVADLPSTHADGDAYVVEADRHLYIWSAEGNQWLDIGEFKGENGKTFYTHVAWAISVTTNPSTGEVTNVTGFTIAKTADDTTHLWMGVYVDENSAADPDDALLYTWSYTKGVQGNNGYNTATLFLYKRSATAISSIDWSNTLTYTFANKTLNPTPTGWSLNTIPSGTDPIYVTAATAYSNTATDSIAPNEWAPPVKYVENGAQGEHGLNTASVFLYQRAASAPTKPSSALTYTFATGVLSGTLGNWSQNIPATDGNPCWVIQATAISAGTTDSITANEWSTQKKLVEDGTSVSVDDANSKTQYAVSTSSTVTPSSWQDTMPTVPQGQFLWTKVTTAFTDGKSTVSYGVSYRGTDGDSVQIDTSRTYIRYSTDKTASQPDDSTFTLPSPPELADGDYLWSLSQTAYVGVSSILKSYSVSRLGIDGPRGYRGPDGYTTHFAYATSADGSQGFSTKNFAGATFIGTYKDDESEDSLDYTDYVWTEWRGASITKLSETNTYKVSDSGTTTPTGTWYNTKAAADAAYAWSVNRYMWTKTDITWSDNSHTTLYSSERNPDDGTSVVIASQSVTYSKQTSGNLDPTTLTYGSYPSSLSKGDWLYSKTTVNYKTSEGASAGTTNSYSVSYIGTDGTSPIYADLDNEMDSISCNTSGNPSSTQTVETNVSLWKGSSPLTINSIKIFDTNESGAEYTSGTARNGIKVTWSASTGNVKCEFATTATISGKKVFCIKLSNTTEGYARILYFTVNGVRPGAEGQPAIIYSLIPSTSSIKKDKNGSLSPSSPMTCDVRKIVGNATPTRATSSDGTLRYRIDGDITSSTDGTELTINTGNVTYTSSNSYIVFAFFVGTTMVDKERVPIVVDGSDGTSPYFLDIDNEMHSVACASDGKPTASGSKTVNVKMWKGSTELTPTISCEPVSQSGVTNTVNQNNKTVTFAWAAETAIGQNNSWTITAVADGVTLTTTFVLNGVRAGAKGDDAVIYELVPSVNQIVKKKDGTYVPTANTYITCSVTKNVGGSQSPPATSEYTLKYKLNGGAETVYTATSVKASDVTSSLQFVLYDKASTPNKIDVETIPLVSDGQDALDAAALILSSSAVFIRTNNEGAVLDDFAREITLTMRTHSKELSLKSVDFTPSPNIADGASVLKTEGVVRSVMGSLVYLRNTGNSVSDSLLTITPTSHSIAPTSIVVTADKDSVLEEQTIFFTATAVDEDGNEYTGYASMLIQRQYVAADGINGEDGEDGVSVYLESPAALFAQDVSNTSTITPLPSKTNVIVKRGNTTVPLTDYTVAKPSSGLDDTHCTYSVTDTSSEKSVTISAIGTYAEGGKNYYYENGFARVNVTYEGTTYVLDYKFLLNAIGKFKTVVEGDVETSIANKTFYEYNPATGQYDKTTTMGEFIRSSSKNTSVLTETDNDTISAMSEVLQKVDNISLTVYENKDGIDLFTHTDDVVVGTSWTTIPTTSNTTNCKTMCVSIPMEIEKKSADSTINFRIYTKNTSAGATIDTIIQSCTFNNGVLTSTGNKSRFDAINSYVRDSKEYVIGVLYFEKTQSSTFRMVDVGARNTGTTVSCTLFKSRKFSVGVSLKDGLIGTGIDIVNGKITNTADQWECQNNSGVKTAWLDDMGNFTVRGVYNNLITVIDSTNWDKYIIMIGSGSFAKFYLDVLRCGTFVMINYLPVSDFNAASDGMLHLPYYANDNYFTRGYTRYLDKSDATPRLMTDNELRMLAGRKMVIKWNAFTGISSNRSLGYVFRPEVYYGSSTKTVSLLDSRLRDLYAGEKHCISINPSDTSVNRSPFLYVPKTFFMSFEMVKFHTSQSASDYSWGYIWMADDDAGSAVQDDINWD